MIEHSGGIPGFSTYAIRMPNDRVYVAALTNRDFESPGRTVLMVAALAVGKPYREPAAVKLAANVLDGYTGVYQVSETDEAVVRRDGDNLVISFPGGRKTVISPLSETQFFVKDSRTRINFTRNPSGNVTGFVVTGAGVEQDAKRTDKPLPPEQKPPDGVKK
jgi:hypothetical protein